MKPQTQYTQSGRINIAYQVIGSGPIDIVYIPGWVSNIDLMWDCPPLVKFFHGLSSIARVILFDKRGTGLSDRVSDLSPLEDRMDDIRAVMDAVGSKRAALFGHSEGGSVSALFAATYPKRVLALITFGVFAKRRYSTDYPWAPTDEQRQEVYDMIERDWGSGDMNLASLAPSMVENTEFMNWLARYFRSGASPNAAMVLTKMNTEVDIIDILETISVPTLLMCRTGDIDVKVAESIYMANKIPGAQMVEFEGSDHLFWAGNYHEVLDEITEFLTGTKPIEEHDSVLATLVFFELIDPEFMEAKLSEDEWDQLLNDFHHTFDQLAVQYRGKLMKSPSTQRLILFEGPSKAVHCAQDALLYFKEKKIETRSGIHMGECTQVDDMLKGMTVHVVHKIMGLAEKNEILISQSVKNLLSGSGLDFELRGPATIRGLDEPILLLSVEHEHHHDDAHLLVELIKAADKPRNHSFLENILHCIENNLSDEQYSVENLSAEVGMSERQLQRKLKAISNKTPNQLIRSVRLHKAKQLLLSGEEEGVAQAAYETGFSSLSYFSKCFKKEFGMGPTELMNT